MHSVSLFQYQCPCFLTFNGHIQVTFSKLSESNRVFDILPQRMLRKSMSARAPALTTRLWPLKVTKVNFSNLSNVNRVFNIFNSVSHLKITIVYSMALYQCYTILPCYSPRTIVAYRLVHYWLFIRGFVVIDKLVTLLQQKHDVSWTRHSTAQTQRWDTARHRHPLSAVEGNHKI